MTAASTSSTASRACSSSVRRTCTPPRWRNTFAQQPAAGSCAVIGVPDLEWGERVYAVVVLRPGAQATAEELHGHVKSLIADYKPPRSVEFVEPMPGVAVHLPRDPRCGRCGARWATQGAGAKVGGDAGADRGGGVVVVADLLLEYLESARASRL
ncbi:hypothetical protein ACFVDQ_32410 [Streptomyces sp. NPDC057684]